MMALVDYVERTIGNRSSYFQNRLQIYLPNLSFIFLAALKKFASSDNKSLREASKYALFEINKKEITPEQESELRATAPPTYTEAVAAGAKSNLSGHVMISYQWGSQERALLVRDKLKEAGYNVWMDVDEMSKIVLSCFSRGSQKGPCR